jgi:hypothetical protein
VIYVDELAACGAPWRGGYACHCWSDASLEELLDFAVRQLGMQESWLQKTSVVHFDLSPKLRRRALELGAVEVSRRSLAWRDAVSRARAAGLTGKAS